MSNSQIINNPLPPVRRIVTGHDSKGRSINISDNEFPTEIVKSPIRTVGIKVLWLLDSVPCRSNGDVEPVDAAFVKVSDLSNDRGVIIRVVDFAPGGKAMMHRTASLDYAVLIAGEIHHVVEESSPVLMKPGDVVIQRGTMHAWSNLSDNWARMHFILIGAEPTVIDGQTLGSAGYHKSAISSGASS